ncbi:hypothetical protein F8388_011907 [Cannabis sativa]|uniref:Uncharacterized protein n=1 Tax=Cannabis sativa TaxID=3483 RepID=A0A7J6GDF5_CANSA|nr:hypothetical protein F8388_011907 [Cannabis sativa]
MINCYNFVWQRCQHHISEDIVIDHLCKELYFQQHKYFETYLFAYLFFFLQQTIMGFRFPGVVQAKQLIQRPFSSAKDVPKGYLAVYVGKSKMTRFVIPVSYLNNSSFQELLCQAEEEFGFDHPMGALTIPCNEDTFINLVSSLNSTDDFVNNECDWVLQHLNSSQLQLLLAYILFLLLPLETSAIMGFRFPGVVHAKQLIQRPFSSAKDVPKGYLAVYVGKNKMTRFIIPVSYLNNSSFQELLCQAEEEFGFDHPMGALTIPCSEDTFINLVSSLNIKAMSVLQITSSVQLRCDINEDVFTARNCESTHWMSTNDYVNKECGNLMNEFCDNVHIGSSASQLLTTSSTLSLHFLPSSTLRETSTIMGFRFPGVVHAKQLIQRPFSSAKDIPKGYLAVYVGKSKMTRFVIPVSYLNSSSFQELLCQAEEEFGFDHPMGALTIPCSEETFINLCYILQLSIQLGSDINEDVFSAWNCESAHGILGSSTSQLLTTSSTSTLRALSLITFSSFFYL